MHPLRRVVPTLLALLLGPSPATGAAAAPTTAVVVAPVENVYLRPDETSPVDDQAILGETVTVLEETAGFARVSGDDGVAGWIPERSLRRGEVPRGSRLLEVTSPTAHLYREPDVTRSRPLMTAPLGATFGLVEELEREGHPWYRVVLPDGRPAFVARTEAEPIPQTRPLGTPADWAALGRRFLGAPYTWGGVTPLGFDCSGLVQTIFRRHGVLLRRNAFEQCFREPQLVPVPTGRLAPGDLLFFGTEKKIDHVGLWVGDGTVLQASSYGVPSTQLTPFTDARLAPRLRYARRLAVLPGAPRPGALSKDALAALEKKLAALAAGTKATWGIDFEELNGTGSVRIGADRTMHAASTMKTAVLLEVLRRVDEGSLALDAEVLVKNEFRSALDGSPFSVPVDSEDEGKVAEHLGKKMPLEILVNEMIDRSSNLATNLVLGLVGPKAVQDLLDRMGAGTVKVRRGVEDQKAYDAGFSNETDAAGMAALMKACVRSPLLSEKARRTAWDILVKQTHNSQIPAGIPSQAGVVVAHKTGEISTAQHDAAIVRLPDGRQYVLVLLASGLTGEEQRRAVVATTREMSRAVWEAMIAP